MNYLIPLHDSLLVDPIERRDLIEEQRRVYENERHSGEITINCEECGQEHSADDDCPTDSYFLRNEFEYDKGLDDEEEKYP